MIFGKLSPSGVLDNMQDTPMRTWGDGSTDVQLVAMPSFDGPYGYDAINKLAIPNPAEVARLLEVARVQAMQDEQWHDVRLTVAADVPTTLATFSDIAGLSFPIAPNENWNAEFNLFCLGSTAGLKLQMTGPANPVRAVIGFDGNTTSQSLKTFNPKASPAYGSPSIAFCANATPFTGIIQVYLQVVNGPTPGVVKLQLASTTAGQTNKALAGSFGMARRAA